MEEWLSIPTCIDERGALDIWLLISGLPQSFTRDWPGHVPNPIAGTQAMSPALGLAQLTCRMPRPINGAETLTENVQSPWQSSCGHQLYHFGLLDHRLGPQATSLRLRIRRG